jgi:nitrate reductase gamma subunit
MITVLYAVLDAAALVFLVGCLIRAVQYARAPIHLRWELYPVPHEDPRQAEHGGSYFEKPDWWTQPTHFNLSGELRAMVPEILFLKGLHEFNRKLWLRSFPFHFGLYLLIASAAVLGCNAVGLILAPHWSAGAIAAASHVFYKYAGITGSILVILSCLSLLMRRLTDQDLRNYTTAGDLFNLAFFVATFSLLIAGYLTRGPDFRGALGLAQGLLTFTAVPGLSASMVAGLVLLALLVAYIPYTHMAHFIAKYFTYHSVRWDDRLHTPGGELERKLAEYLTYRPTWAAAHIGADGRKTWLDIARANPTQEVPK